MNEFRIGIVGGSGYIGSTLAKYLSRKFEVKILDKSPYHKENKAKKIEYKFCDILKYEEVEQGLRDVDVVIHTAIVQIPLINEYKKLGYEVNMLGTQNVCRVVSETPSMRGMILTGSWHVFGEEKLEGIIDEKFGFRPDKVEDRAYLYVLSKVAQEIIVRFYDQMSSKIYATIRLGTVLGEGMPEKTAANIFISKGLKGESITPYKHTMYRPMLYVDVNDVCRAFEAYVERILNGEIQKGKDNPPSIVNLCWPYPVTIIELAQLVKEVTIDLTKGRVRPKIEIIDKKLPMLHSSGDAKNVRVDISRVEKFLGLKKLTNPKESIRNIIRARLTYDSVLS